MIVTHYSSVSRARGPLTLSYVSAGPIGLNGLTIVVLGWTEKTVSDQPNDHIRTLTSNPAAGASIGQTSSSNDSSTPLPSNEQRESSLTPPPTPSHSQDSPPPRSSIHNAISPHSPRGSKRCHMLSATPSDEEDIDSSSKADTQAMTSQSVPKKKKKITSQSRSAAARKGAQTRAARKAAQQQGKPTVST